MEYGLILSNKYADSSKNERGFCPDIYRTEEDACRAAKKELAETAYNWRHYGVMEQKDLVLTITGSDGQIVCEIEYKICSIN